MKKQIFLFFAIGLSFFNITSFSMQQDDKAIPLSQRSQRRIETTKDFSTERNADKEKDRPLSPEENEKLSSKESYKFDLGEIEEYPLIRVNEEKKKRANDFIRSMIIGAFPEDQSHIAQENIDFLELIQEYSLEGNYREAPFILFQGPFGTGKTTLADKFAFLLNKRIKKISLKGVKRNKEIFQWIIKKHIEPIITEDGEPGIIFLDEINKLFEHSNFNRADRAILIRRLHDCLSEAQRINQEKKQQQYFVIATTNHPERIKELLPFFKHIEIDNPNFDHLVKILSNLISRKSPSFDLSTLDQSTIENIAKRFEGISIRGLRPLIEHSTRKAQREYRETFASGQQAQLTKPSLCERHFIINESEINSINEELATELVKLQKLGLRSLEESIQKVQPSKETIEAKTNTGDFDSIAMLHEEFAPIVDEEEKERENSFIHNYFIENNQINQSHNLPPQAVALESIQKRSLEDHYEETQFVLFHGTNETDKIVIARKFARLLNKKVKSVCLDTLEKTDKEYIQQFIEEQIDKIITEESGPCVILLNNVEKLLLPSDANDNNRRIIAQNLAHCLSKVQRINQEKNQQQYFVVATINLPETIIPQEVSDFFIHIEISNPNFEKRVEILNNVIYKMDNTIDTSACNQDLIEDVAKTCESCSISKLNRIFEQAIMIAQQEHDEVYSLKNNRVPLLKRHITQAKKLLDDQDSSAQQTEETSAQQGLFKKIGNFFSKYLLEAIFNRGKADSIKIDSIKDHSCQVFYKLTSIIVIAFHFLLRR